MITEAVMKLGRSLLTKTPKMEPKSMIGIVTKA